MDQIDDRELLDEFVESGSERAFCTLVARYTDLVFGAAMRKTGDRGTAEEVAQNVFALLARKAGSLNRKVMLGGWLYRTAMFECSHATRKQIARKRNMEALARHQSLAEEDSSTPPALEDLDGALGKISQSDQDILLLRFEEGLGFREIGERLGKSEDASQKKTSRALDKLQRALSRRGVTLGAAALASGLGAEFAKAAPAGLASSLGNAALVGVPQIGGGALAAHTLQMMSYGKLAKGGALAVLLAALPIAVQQTQIASARSELAEIEPVSVESKARPQRVAPASGLESVASSRFVDVDDWLEHVISGTSEWSTIFDRWTEIAKLTAEQRDQLLLELERHPGGGHPKDDLIDDLLRRMAHDRPAEALNHAIRMKRTGGLALMLETWAKADAQAAIDWFISEQQTGSLMGTAIPAGEENGEAWILWRLTKAAAAQDQRLALDLAAKQENANARWALYGVALAHIEQGRSGNLAQAAKTVQLSSIEKNRVFVDAFKRSVTQFGETAASWMMAQSSPGYLAENIQSMMNAWGQSNAQAAEAWIPALSDSVLRDHALAGLAVGQVEVSAGWRGYEIPREKIRGAISRIENETLRSATAARVEALIEDHQQADQSTKSNEE